jgi:hypothetical protein
MRLLFLSSLNTDKRLPLLRSSQNDDFVQQTISIHPNNNRGTETQQSASDFDTNGNLLNLNCNGLTILDTKIAV